MKKLYCVRKYVYAENAKEALKKEHKQPVYDVYVDAEWQKDNIECFRNEVASLSGFKIKKK